MHYNACVVGLIASLQLAVERQSRVAISSLPTTKTATRAGGFSRGLLFRWIAAMWAEDFWALIPSVRSVHLLCRVCQATARNLDTSEIPRYWFLKKSRTDGNTTSSGSLFHPSMTQLITTAYD